MKIFRLIGNLFFPSQDFIKGFYNRQKAGRYILGILTVFSFLTIYAATHNSVNTVRNSINEFNLNLEAVITQLPPITITDGILSINQSAQTTLYDTETNPLILFSLDKDLLSFNEVDENIRLIANRTSLLIHNNEEEPIRIPLAGIDQYYLDKTMQNEIHQLVDRYIQQKLGNNTFISLNSIIFLTHL